MRLPMIAGAALSLAACAVTAPDHQPQWMVTVAGDYKDVAACTFDKLRPASHWQLATAVNEPRSTARVWDNRAFRGSPPMEITFHQTAPDQVQVEYRNTDSMDSRDEKTTVLNVVRECRQRAGR